MDRKNKYPLRYYAILLLAVILALLFWLIVFGGRQRLISAAVPGKSNTEQEYWNQPYLPDQPGRLVPIDTTKIIDDTISKRKIISNLVNIAVKTPKVSIARFANDLKKIYHSNDYKIVYIDSVVNRLQVELSKQDRTTFKTEVKAKLKNYQLLVWDEALFKSSKVFNDPELKDSKANWYLRAINIDKAWQETTGNKNVIVAVIDNGFDLNHPELKGKAIKPYNVIEKTKDVRPSPENHGTHVASTIVANGNNGQGLVGICPDCSFMPLKVADANGNMTSSYIIDALLYAIKNNADVVNLSLGFAGRADANMSVQQQEQYIKTVGKDEEAFWDDLFTYADQKKMICVLSAGNSNMITGFDPFQRSKNTIKVGAIDQRLAKADFSNYGGNTTIYAPGIGILGAKPGNKYEIMEGTSMAAPIVTGIVGLIKSKNKNITPEAVIKILNRNSVNRNNIKIIDVIDKLN